MVEGVSEVFLDSTLGPQSMPLASHSSLPTMKGPGGEMAPEFTYSVSATIRVG